MSGEAGDIPQQHINPVQRLINKIGFFKKPSPQLVGPYAEPAPTLIPQPDLIQPNQEVPIPVSSPMESPIIDEVASFEPEIPVNIDEHLQTDHSEEPIKVRITGIGSEVQQRIEEAGLVIPDIENAGQPAIITTNETHEDGFFEGVQKKHPDGYLIGIGAGNSMTMPQLYEDGVIPKAIILADIDPRVIAVGRLLIQHLKSDRSALELEKNFYGMSFDQFRHELVELIVDEPNQDLKRRLVAIEAEKWEGSWKYLATRVDPRWKQERRNNVGQNIDVVGATFDKFDVLKQLATEDNIVMAYADFTDPKFINIMRSLPEFNESTNVIYSSNITDHITGRGHQMENPNHPAIFIDTLGQGLNYYLRASNSLPQFRQEDFYYRSGLQRGDIPKGLLFGGSSSGG